MLPKTRSRTGRTRIRGGLITVLVGFFIFLVGADPGLFGLDRSPVMGYVQIAVFLVGLALICLGGYITISGLWNSTPKTIAADIGLRLVATGYVISMASGMADLLGFGTHRQAPTAAFFGVWQMRGVLLGEAVIALGFLLLIPPRHHPVTGLESGEGGSSEAAKAGEIKITG
jgi:hypothetical protein